MKSEEKSPIRIQVAFFDSSSFQATEILKKQQLNIRDARISTKEDSPRACHFYVVQDKLSGSGLSEHRLAQAHYAGICCNAHVYKHGATPHMSLPKPARKNVLQGNVLVRTHLEMDSRFHFFNVKRFEIGGLSEVTWKKLHNLVRSFVEAFHLMSARFVQLWENWRFVTAKRSHGPVIPRRR